MRPRSAWQAITLRPLRFLASSWPWRSLLYLLCGIALGAATAATLFALFVGGVLLLFVLIGLVAFVAIALSGIVFARFERWRLRLVDMDPAEDPHRRPPRRGLRPWLLTRLREQATWREFGYTVVSLVALCWIDAGMVAAVLGIPVALAATPLYGPDMDPLAGAVFVVVGLALLPFAAYPITAWAGARAALTRAVLSPRDTELGAQLTEVTRSRARLADAFGAERQRIERDLHDGAQQRLVSLTMALGLARLDLPPDSPAAEQVALAHEQAKLALAELRELIRGVHPQVLTDRGLAAAVRDLAGRSVVPVDVDIELPHRLPAAVELTAYFVAAEALANVAKHSGADRARVRGRLHGDIYLQDVFDNGVGGADADAGTGLTGLGDRVDAAGGRLLISSPPGGPTLVRAELPC
ncbi:sensor histidine kinase [Luedemannella flava]|uniref:histidine kinase n=1 Tax=Luedemannella flava TaxID=349316 RepID=A0ABP4XUG5_9ACTN